MSTPIRRGLVQPQLRINPKVEAAIEDLVITCAEQYYTPHIKGISVTREGMLLMFGRTDNSIKLATTVGEITITVEE